MLLAAAVTTTATTRNTHQPMTAPDIRDRRQPVPTGAASAGSAARQAWETARTGKTRLATGMNQLPTAQPGGTTSVAPATRRLLAARNSHTKNTTPTPNAPRTIRPTTVS